MAKTTQTRPTLSAESTTGAATTTGGTGAATNAKIPVGISACLLGDKVRYNAGHSQSRLCMGPLADYFEYHRFCPEVTAGFGIPRPTLRLTGDPQHPDLVYSDRQQINVRQQLEDACAPWLEQLHTLDGYILMKNSPSCGMERVKVYRDNGYPNEQSGRGVFADALLRRYPHLPVEEDGRLNDTRLRDSFILRVFAHHRFRHAVDARLSYKALLDFHSEYKYLLMAHCQAEYRGLGRLLAESAREPLPQVRDEYFGRFMQALKKPGNRGAHCNVLLHLLGYIKRAVDQPVRADIVQVIEQYRRGEVNLATPLTLLYHYLRRYGSDYVKAQRYLEPYPQALGMRNYF